MTKTSKFLTFIIFWPLLPTPIWRNYLSGTFSQVQQLFGYFKAIRIKMHREVIAVVCFWDIDLLQFFVRHRGISEKCFQEERVIFCESKFCELQILNVTSQAGTFLQQGLTADGRCMKFSFANIYIRVTHERTAGAAFHREAHGHGLGHGQLPSDSLEWKSKMKCFLKICKKYLMMCSKAMY